MPPRNPWLCLVVAGSLGGAFVISTAGVIILAGMAREIPQALVGLAAGSLGALSAFLTQIPRGSAGGGNAP